MDFFRSILADDSEPESPNDHEESDPSQSPEHQQIERPESSDVSNPKRNSSENDDDGGGLWGLVRNLTTRSESVLETYRRDLQEFGSGLRKESDLIREVASRAVKDLPSSSATAFDGVLKSTADIIAQGKEALLAHSDFDESDSSVSRGYDDRGGLNSRRFSRFDYRLSLIHNDSRTFCEDPEDLEDYKKWKLGFVLGDKRDEIEKLVGENGDLEGIYAKIVPNEVDDGTFWFRYFYKVHKLKQQEDIRAKLVKRSLSIDDDDEDLSWDIDDEDEEEEEKKTDQVNPNPSKSQNLPEIEKKDSLRFDPKTESSKLFDDNKEKNDKNNVEEPKPSGQNVYDDKVEGPKPSDEKVESGKEGHVSSVTKKDSLKDEEDLEWDEIEDLGDSDDKKSSQSDIPNKDELRRRLSTAVADDEEDLSWDIEDDVDYNQETGKGGGK